MKKSKIIVPALALLAFTSISSVSGTVAWFTASRGGSFSTSNFTVVNPEGNMGVKLTKAIGTEISTSGDKVNVTTDSTANSQVDASFDHKNQVLWEDIPSDDGSQPTTFRTVNLSESEAKVEDHVYRIISWSATFSYTFGADTDQVNLYFNAAESTFTVADKVMSDADNTKGHLYTYRGFRVAMVDSTKSQERVWAPQQLATECKYISDTDGTTGTYTPALSGSTLATTGDLISSDCIPTKITAGETGSTERADYLGCFTTSSTTIGITFYAWFEGTDPNIVNDVRMDKVSVDMKFYCRNNAA